MLSGPRCFLASSPMAEPTASHRWWPACLQYASKMAYERFKNTPPEGSIAECLLFASEDEESGRLRAILRQAVETLFRDAKVSYRRVSRRGDEYNILDRVLWEFLHWDDMP